MPFKPRSGCAGKKSNVCVEKANEQKKKCQDVVLLQFPLRSSALVVSRRSGVLRRRRTI